jgi:hypothetical protein
MIDDCSPGEKRRVEFVGGPNDGESALMRVARVEWLVPTRDALRGYLDAVPVSKLVSTTGFVGVYRRASATTFEWQGYR